MFTNILGPEPIELELERILNMQSPRIEKEARFQSGEKTVIIDYVLEDQNTLCYVEVKRRVTPEAVARFYATEELIRSVSSQSGKNEKFLIVGREVDPVSFRIAERLDIKIERVYMDSSTFPSPKSNEPFRIKITADKAWKSVTTLLKHQPTSIYNVKKQSGVSYGEAHRVVSYLKSRGLINKSGNYVSIANFRPILNAVFWERSFFALAQGSYYVNSQLAGDLVREVSTLLKESKIKHVFTGFIAYEKYFGGIRTQAPLDLYIDFSNPGVDDLIEQFSTIDNKKPNLVIYKPDRDVFSDSNTVGGIQLVCREQLLLDLSGGDSISIQYATEMVKFLGKV